MEDHSYAFPELNEINNSIRHIILYDEEETAIFCKETIYLNQELFTDICMLYGYPLTVIWEQHYIDKMYRDAYYAYLSHLHFDIERYCQRLGIFRDEIPFETFFDSDNHSVLQEKCLGTIVIRPSYNRSSEYTLGRTLLNPYKLKRPFRYIRTAEYKATICGQTYTIDAFPFSNQHGDVLRCAETSVWELMEYYGTRYENYSVILPSTILNWASEELPARSLPSDGLTYIQVSSLLKTFGFEPRIYERLAYNIESDKPSQEHESGQSAQVAEIGNEDSAVDSNDINQNPYFASIEEPETELEAEEEAAKISARIKERSEKAECEREAIAKSNGKLRRIPLHNLFHYYVESGIPLIMAICNRRENMYHSIIAIGHDERSPRQMKRKNLQGEIFKYGNLYMLDSASLYERYIVIDDNQYPYRSELFDHFSVAQNCRVEAFIVPLYRHILLDAESAVSIIETVYRDFQELIEKSLKQLDEEEELVCKGNSIDNPVVLRYYLTTSRGFVSFRCRETEYIEEKVFYSTVSLPKFIWVGEYSTAELYYKGKILGEVIVDATAPKYSGVGALIATRICGRCAARKNNEPVDRIRACLEGIGTQQADSVYNMYTNNLQKEN